MSSSQLWENSDGEEDDLPYPPSSPGNLQGTSVPLFTDQWQDSLALSSYLKLRRDTAANTSTQGGIGGASTDASPARPGFQAPLSASTGNTVPSFLNQFIMKPLLDSAKKPGQMRNIDQISVIDPETSFLSTTSRQTNNADDFLRSAIPRDDGDDLFAMADDDDGNQHGNMDKMGLKLLLRTALRDKDIANHRIHQLNDSIHHIEVEKQHLLQQSQSVYAIHASANRWKLPIIVLWCYQQFEIRQCTKAWQRWQRKIHLQKTHTLQQHQHQLIINIAKKNLMKVRNTKQQIAFIRWKCWQQYQVQQELFNNRLLQKFRKQHLQRFHFQFWKQFSHRNQLLKKVIYRCKSYRKMRMSFQRWRQLPHRHQRREDRHKLQQLTCLHLLQHQQRQQSQLKHSWLLWKQHVTYQHRVMTRRQLFVMMLKKNHWHQSTLWYCFTRWKARIIYQLPKLTRLCHCLHQGYHRMYRKAWKQWKANVALDRLKHMTLHRMVKTVHKKEVVNKVSHAFHQWRHSLCEQKMAIYHKHHVMMKSQHQRLSVSLVHVVYLHCLRRTWCQWKSFSTLSTTNNKYSHQLDDVKHANHSLRQTITQSSHQHQDLLQQYQDLQHRQQRLHHKTSLQRLQSYFRCAYFLHIQDVFAKWKAFSNSTLLQHRYQHQLTMIRHHQLLQQSDVVTKRHQDHVYRMVWQQWYRGCRQVKTLRRISASFVRYDVAARLKQRFDCWHRQTQSQRQVQRVLHVMLNKTRSHAQRYYWHLWKSQVYIQQRHQHLLQHAVLCLKKAHSFQVVHAFFRWKQSLYQQEVHHWRHDCNLWRRLSEQQVLRRHYTAWRDVIKRRQLSHKYLRRCTLRQHQHQIQKTFAIWKRFARFQQHRQHAVQSIAYLSVRKQHQAITISHQRSQQEVCFHHWKYHCFTRHRVQIGEDLEGKYQQCLPVMQSLRLSLQHLQLQHDLLTTQHSDLNVDMQHQEDLQFRILQKYHQFQCKYRIFRQWYQRIQCYRKITSWQQKTSRKVIQSTLWRWKYAYAQQRLMTSNQIYVQDVVQQFSAKKTLQRLWHYWKEYLLETRFALLQREEVSLMHH